MKKKKKRGFRIFILFFIAFILLLGIMFLLCAYVFKISVKGVVVHNNSVIPDNNIIELSKLDEDSNFLLVSKSSIKNNVKKDELIKKVKVKKSVFFEIHIYVEENKPLMYREDVKKIVLNNKKEIEKKDYYKLDVPSLVNYVPDKTYEKLIKKMNEADYEVIKKISDIKYFPNDYDEERFVLYMMDSNLVYINLPKFKNINKYDEMVEQFEGKTGKLYLDSGNYFEYDKKTKEVKVEKKVNKKSEKTN